MHDGLFVCVFFGFFFFFFLFDAAFNSFIVSHPLLWLSAFMGVIQMMLPVLLSWSIVYHHMQNPAVFLVYGVPCRKYDTCDLAVVADMIQLRR